MLDRYREQELRPTLRRSRLCSKIASSDARIPEQKYDSVVDGPNEIIQVAVQAASGATHTLRGHRPACTFVVNDERGVAALIMRDPSAIAKVCLDGNLDRLRETMEGRWSRPLYRISSSTSRKCRRI